ncbi:MAG: hypothetical protein ACRD3W_11935 [Terriglobales bacterium]
MDKKPKRKSRQRIASKRDQDVAATHAAGLRKLIAPNGNIPNALNDAILGLEHFAEHGTFVLTASEPHRARQRYLAYVGPRYRWLRGHGRGHDPAVLDLAVELDRSESTIRSWLRAVGITAQQW